MQLRSLVLAFVLVTATAAADTPPRLAEIAGHEFGDRITVAEQAERWLRALADSSDRIAYVEQGRSWEGRPLMLAVITSASNHARLDEIRDVARRLEDPRLAQPDAATIARQPVIVWLGGSIHGFELSGTEGLLMLVEQLVTADDAATRALLDQAVVLIDPMLNPDGRDAFAHHNHQRIGSYVNAAREDWANDFTFWEALSFRTGHYFFDTNRDWFAHTQMETLQRMPTFRAWRPQVAVDAHEMGPDNEFFFDPPTDPVAPFFPGYASRGFEIFGAAYVSAFDGARFDYTTRQMYNYFYPGYTTSWTSYQGAVGMLYEQGSSRGLALERSDGTVRTLLDAARQQHLAALTAVRTAVANRGALLDAYAAAAREAIADGNRGVRRYLVPPGSDPQLTDELAQLLARNGIEVGVTTEPVSLRGLRDARGATAGSRTLAAGTLVIEAAQPRNRLIRTLLEPNMAMPEEFLAQARARMNRGENPRFYDITAYSLPLLFDLDSFSTTDAHNLPVQPWAANAMPEVAAGGYAWLIDGRQTATAAVAVHLRAQGTRVRVVARPFRHEGHDYAGGTLVIRADGDHATTRGQLQMMAQRYGVSVRTTGTGLAESGIPALGTNEGYSVAPAEVALLGDHPVHGYSFGWAWYTLDRQYGIPTTVLRARSLGDTPLEGYTTLVIPALTQSGELTRMLGDGGKDRLRRWVQDGGTLVAIGNGADWVRTTLELGALRDWYADNEDAARIDVPGTFVRAELDGENWMTAGYDNDMPFLVISDRLWLAPTGAANSRQRVVARYAAAESLRIAGHLWPENTERLPGAVAVYEERVGRGRIVLFAEDPNFRAYWRGANRLFLNAVLLGPSAP